MSSTDEDLRKAENELKELNTKIHILQKKRDKLALANLKTALIPCDTCIGTGEDYWEEGDDCEECDGTGCYPVPIHTEKKNYTSVYELINTLFDGE